MTVRSRTFPQPWTYLKALKVLISIAACRRRMDINVQELAHCDFLHALVILAFTADHVSGFSSMLSPICSFLRSFGDGGYRLGRE